MPDQYTPTRPAVSRVCEQCSEPFKIAASALDRGENRGRFCSKACQSANWMAPQPRICVHCNSPFLASGTAIRNGGGFYCSVSCRQAGARNRLSLTCLICHTSFEVEPYRTRQGHLVYCSKTCADVALSQPLAERFWTHVNKTETCWLWTGHIEKNGYARTRRGGGKNGHIGVHVAAFEMSSGSPVPSDKAILHTCDVRHCVRNDDSGIYVVRGRVLPRFGHLALGTNTDNVHDMLDKGRHPNSMQRE